MNLRRTDKATVTEKKLISIDELRDYLSIGRSNALKIGKESGALRKIGKRALYDREVIDRYIDNLGA